MTIAAHLHCLDCGIGFAVTCRQHHAGLLAEVVRCPACRTLRRRVFGRARTQRWRLSVRDAESAPTRAPLHPAGVERFLAAVYADDDEAAA